MCTSQTLKVLNDSPKPSTTFAPSRAKLTSPFFLKFRTTEWLCPELLKPTTNKQKKKSVKMTLFCKEKKKVLLFNKRTKPILYIRKTLYIIPFGKKINVCKRRGFLMMKKRERICHKKRRSWGGGVMVHRCLIL